MTSRADIVSLGVLLSIGAAYQLPLLFEGVGLIDEGHLANAALRVHRGEVLYRDVYSVYPPGSFYVVAGLFDVFTPSLIVIRAFHIALTLALATAVYGLARRLMEAPGALLAGLLVVATGWEAILERCHYGYLYGVFPISALWLLAVLDEREGTKRHRLGLLAVGALAGVTLAFRLVPFLALACAVPAFLLARGQPFRATLERLGWIIAGGLGVLAPIAAGFALASAGAALAEAVFWTSIEQYLGGGQFNLPFPALQFFPSEGSPTGFHRLFMNWEFYLPILIYGVSLLDFALTIHADRHAPRKDPRIALRIAVTAFGAILFLRVTGRSDYYHLAPVLMPAYVLGADLLTRLGRQLSPTPRPTLAWIAVAALMIASFLLHDVPRTMRGALDDADEVALSPGGPRIPATSPVHDLIFALRTRPDQEQTLLVLPFYPVVYFLADRKNPTRYDWIFPGYLKTDDERAALIRQIEDSGVETLVYAPGAIDGDPARRMSSFEPRLDRFLRRRFVPKERFGRFVVMRRRER